MDTTKATDRAAAFNDIGGRVMQMATIRDNWLLGLQELAVRHSYLGVAADLPTLTLIELWGVYGFLMGIEGGS